MNIPYYFDQIEKDLKDFSGWIVEQGGEVLEPTNAYEVLRVKASGKTYVLYQKATGKLTWPEILRGAYKAYKGDKNWKGFVRIYGKGYRAGQVIGKLRQRDGDFCFYCGLECDDDNATVEHLLSKSHGGSNKIENMVLAHQECNVKAGNLSVYEKVLLRDTIRQAAQ